LEGVATLDKEQFFLMGSMNTPLLKIKPILRGTEDGQYFEGDILYFRNDFYLVVWEEGGFVARSGESVVSIAELDGCPVTATAILKNLALLNLPREMRFKHNNHSFVIYRMKGISEENLIIGHDGWRAVPPSEVQQCTFMTMERDYLYFGDEVDDGIVVMHKGRVCVKRGEHITELKPHVQVAS
jgi:hypothetical protein